MCLLESTKLLLTKYIRARGSDQQTPVQSTRQEQLDAGSSAFQFLEILRSIVPTNLGTHSIPSKISDISERFIAKLSEFNQSQKIIYINDISEKDNFNFTEYENKLAEIGFTLKEGVIELVYKGNDPAGALDKLMDLDLLITDCKVSLNIIDYLLLKEDVGTQQFNRIIKK